MPNQSTYATQPLHKHLQKDEEDAEISDELLTVSEVAQVLKVDDTTCRRWIKHGALRAITLPHKGKRQAYRIRKRELDKILAGTGSL